MLIVKYEHSFFIDIIYMYIDRKEVFYYEDKIKRNGW